MGVPFRGKEEVPGTHQAYTTIAFLIRITTISKPHTIALYALQFPLGYPCLPVPSFASPRGLPVQRRGIRFHTSDPPESQRSLRCFSEGPIYPLPSLPLHPREVVRRSCPSRLIALKPRCHKASSMFERVFREGILGQMDSSGHYAESIMSRKFF